ncbi:MAG: PTS sugar transporter subunit IIC [Turicibacter sp.]|nr:PTS sugar transporter subunit IIC [Turicibacter sp.]
MQKFFEVLERTLLPFAGKIGSQRHMAAIRDAFSVIMTPLIIGSLAVLINTFPFDGYQAFMLSTFGDNWRFPMQMVLNMTLGILSIHVALGLGYHLGKHYKLDGFVSASMSLIAFMILTPMTEDGGINMGWVGARGLFLAMIVAIVSVEVFRFIVARGWVIKMPDGVPPAVTQGFIALIPGTIIFLSAGLLTGIIYATTDGLSASELIYRTLQAPFQQMSNNVFAVALLIFARGFLWFFGIHGTNVLSGLTNSMLLPNMEANIQYFMDGGSANTAPYIATTTLTDAFVSMGGTGVGLALIFGVILFSKNKGHRNLSIGATPAGLFNINEPMVFGIPIVLNPVLFIPFLLAPVVSVFVAWFAISVGLVPRTVAMIPWNMPIGIGGYLATGGSIRGSILQFVNLGISILIYLPFIRLNDRVVEKQVLAQQAEEK